MDRETTYDDTEADPAERSLVEDLRLLASDGQVMVSAELAYQVSRARAFGGGIGAIVGLAAAALLLASLALVGLVVGLIFALTPVLTAWGATAVVVAVLIAVAVALALWARSRWQALTDTLG